MEESRKNICLRISIVSLSILLMGSFWLSVRGSSNPADIAVMPVVTRECEPILVTFKLSNPLPIALLINYQLYANGELLVSGDTTIPHTLSEIYRYAYVNPYQIGEQLNFVVRTQSELGNHETILSLPAYPPQIWSSFVSFASFSTSIMSSMSSMAYYQSTFGSQINLNLGLLFTLVLAALLIFLELSQPLLQQRTITVLGRLRLRFSTVTWILFIIFMGILYTTVLMIV